MSWLNERILEHLYRSEDGDELIHSLAAVDEIPEALSQNGKSFRFVETLPYKTYWTVRTSFERNGVVGYKYDNGDGKPRYVSATRERYEKNIGNTPGHKLAQLKKERRLSELSNSVTTKGYKEAYKKLQEKKGAKNANKRRD